MDELQEYLRVVCSSGEASLPGNDDGLTTTTTGVLGHHGYGQRGRDSGDRSKIRCDDALHAALRWVTHNPEDRKKHLQALLEYVKLDRCTADGIRAVLNTHGALLDEQPMIYKLLIKALI